MNFSLNFFQFFMIEELEGSNLRSMYSIPYQSTYPIEVRLLAPSSFKMWPVIPSALSEVKNVTARPTSSGKTRCLNGLFSCAQFLRNLCSPSLYPEYRYMLDSTVDGATALTRTPKGAYSRAAALVSISSHAFDMA